tara:strand:+ start:155 stop:664 length:510 start_codon:yes stop_codon:yes gene_type:complete
MCKRQDGYFWEFTLAEVVTALAVFGLAASLRSQAKAICETDDLDANLYFLFMDQKAIAVESVVALVAAGIGLFVSIFFLYCNKYDDWLLNGYMIALVCLWLFVVGGVVVLYFKLQTECNAQTPTSHAAFDYAMFAAVFSCLIAIVAITAACFKCLAKKGSRASFAELLL